MPEQSGVVGSAQPRQPGLVHREEAWMMPGSAGGPMRRDGVRVAIVCDLREEQWHSMDLVADVLMEKRPGSGYPVTASRLCPPMVPRWSRLSPGRRSVRLHLADRLTGRLWDYPRWLARQKAAFGLFHIVDHSYAHLVKVLPPERTIVTCHDIDALRAALPGGPRLGATRMLASGILDGLGRAAHICCVSEATRRELIDAGVVPGDRISVVHVAPHPACSPVPSRAWDDPIKAMLGTDHTDLLHVGATIPRKRIDLLLEIVAGARSRIPNIRLIRIGGALTRAQRSIAARRHLDEAIVEMPYLDRRALAAVYRHSALLLLPSEREGFGLPVIEALACGTPVVASDLAALREVGGGAAAYCPVGTISSWVDTIESLLLERESKRDTWTGRRDQCVIQAARFDWSDFSRRMAALYCQIDTAAAA
jgi:glycosyltransferase involved in cell wall biosynthesis